jgi:hypothetical protein
MKASKDWGPCRCNCGKNICSGNDFVMIEGAMYLEGHENKRTRQIPAVKPEPEREKSKSSTRSLPSGKR